MALVIRRGLGGVGSFVSILAGAVKYPDVDVVSMALEYSVAHGVLILVEESTRGVVSMVVGHFVPEV
jgi:hypothetical protein